MKLVSREAFLLALIDNPQWTAQPVIGFNISAMQYLNEKGVVCATAI